MWIELVDDHYEILMGRMPDQTGAHCTQEGMNSKSLGICFIGNFDLTPPENDQWNLGIKLVKYLIYIYKIPIEKVKGHREFASYKTCPGIMFDLDKFRGELQ